MGGCISTHRHGPSPPTLRNHQEHKHQHAAVAAPPSSVCHLPSSPGNVPYKLGTYPNLHSRKIAMHTAFDVAGASPAHRTLLLAMGMLETTTLCAKDRDCSKDNTCDGSANVSLWNLSVDMVQQLGYRHDPRTLNDDEHLPTVVRLLCHGFELWGIERVLNFVRGGHTAFEDGSSYGAAEYRNTIASIVVALDRDPQLLHDDRRVEIFLAHV